VWLLQKRRWWTALLLGAAAGLALASKHTAAFTVAGVFAACAAYPIIERITNRRNDGIRARYIVPRRVYALLLVAGVIALGVFYALNPAWWGDPVGRAALVLDLRADLLAGQTAAFGGYASAGDGLDGFFRQAFVNLPQYYEVPVWGQYLADPIARYEASIWRGVSIGGSVVGGAALVVLVVIGLIGLIKAGGERGTRWLVGVWALAMIVTTALLTPVEWQRYYLPVYPAMGLLAAYGLVWLVRRFQRR
jgi:hypothetical protein